MWNDGTVSSLLIILGSSVVAVAGGAAVNILYEILTKKASTKNRAGWAVLMFMLAVNLSMLSLLLVKVDGLNSAQRIQATFISPEEGFVAMRQAVEDTQDGSTIYAVNSFEVPFLGLQQPGGPDKGAATVENARAEDARKRYYDAIEERMEHVNYYRLIQIRDSETANIAQLVGPLYIDHFKKILALQDKPGDKATSLRVAHTHYSMSFVIVENAKGGRCYLFWQVDKRLPAQGGYKAAGYMYVVDPDQVIISRFKSLYHQVEQEKGVRLVRQEELEPDAPPALPNR